MTTIGPDGKITTGPAPAPVAQPAPQLVALTPAQQIAPPAPVPVKVVPAISKITHVVAGLFAALAAFALTPAGEAIIKQYPHLAVIAVFLPTLAGLYKSPQVDA